MGMTVSDPLTQLIQKALDQRGGKRPGVRALAVRINELLEIRVDVLEDEVKQGLAVLLLAVDVLDAEEADDVEGLGQHLEQGDLPECGRRHAFLVHLQPRLLRGHQLSSLLVLRLVHLPVRAFPYLLQLLVFLHFFFLDGI